MAVILGVVAYCVDEKAVDVNLLVELAGTAVD
jgi:hypothetical protein